MLTNRQVHYIMVGVLTEWIEDRIQTGVGEPSADDALNCPKLQELLRGTRECRGHMRGTGAPLEDVESVQFAVDRISEWISIYEENLGRRPHVADPYHSALLPRLLSGKEAFATPPPKLYSRPSYELAEGAPVEVDVKRPNCGTGGSEIRIGDSNELAWEAEDAGIVKHLSSGELYRLRGRILQKLSAVDDTDSLAPISRQVSQSVKPHESERSFPSERKSLATGTSQFEIRALFKIMFIGAVVLGLASANFRLLTRATDSRFESQIEMYSWIWFLVAFVCVFLGDDSNGVSRFAWFGLAVLSFLISGFNGYIL